MEDIQHRLDCPARKHLNEQVAIEVLARWVELDYVMVSARCRYCRRGALVKAKNPEESK